MPERDTAARTLTTTTESVPQMRGITPRWLLLRLPWVRVYAGVYRVNRRLAYRLGDGLVTFVNDGAEVRVVPPELAELPPLRGLAGNGVLDAVAGRFERREYGPGETIAQAGRPAGAVHLIAHGKVEMVGEGEYGGETGLGIPADGRFFGERVLLGATQALLRVHTRVADLCNGPMNQVEQQLRLTVEAVRERQEHELINNRDFGLLHNADLRQRIQTRGGPPTPDDLDELLARRSGSRFFLAHPKAIAAFGRECTRRGVYPSVLRVDGPGGAPQAVQAWRGVPIYPCDKIPVTASGTSSILVMRTGEDDEGVVGLRPARMPDEVEPGLSVRFAGIDERAVMTYLVSAYHSAAVLVPDALGVLENVEIAR